MIYLDNAATEGFKPASVQSAVLASMRACANPGRSGHRLSLSQGEHVLACRNLLSELFGGYGYERVVFTQSCTQALNFAILGILKAGDHAVVSTLEHNSVLRPLEYLKKNKNIDYSVVPLDENGEITADMVASFVNEHTKLVAITAASNVTGQTPNLQKIREKLPERVFFLVDGAQGAGHIPINMKATGIDALAIAGHKGMHAIQGGAALLFSPRFCADPILFGGTGSESFNLDMPEYYPDRLEAGTLSYPAICSLFEGALLVKAHMNGGAQNLVRMTSAVQNALLSLRDYELFFRPNPCGITAFRHKKLPSDQIAEMLSERFDIAVRGGLHCAPLAHKALGTFPEGLVRASFSPFQSMREVNSLISALKQIHA